MKWCLQAHRWERAELVTVFCTRNRSEVRQWLRDVWPLIEGDPTPAAWASRWQETQAGLAAGAD
jgi:hypothetical protein